MKGAVDPMHTSNPIVTAMIHIAIVIFAQQPYTLEYVGR